MYGVGPLDDDSEGVGFDMEAGDIAVHAAGVAHRNTWSSDDYVYMGEAGKLPCFLNVQQFDIAPLLGLYPKGAPKWNNNFCKADEDETKLKAEEASKIPVPDFDPVVSISLRTMLTVQADLPSVWPRRASA